MAGSLTIHTMKKVIVSIIVIGALFTVVLVLKNSGPGIQPDGTGASPPQTGTVQKFDLSTFTNPTSNFVAELANLLIEKTK